MTPWDNRAQEELALFNPSFCATLLWCAAEGATHVENATNLTHGPESELLYLVLPLVLHRVTRDALPRDTRTSLLTWTNSNSLLCLLLAERARVLVPFTREGLNFGGRYSLLRWDRQTVVANSSFKKKNEGYAKKSTTEVQDCIRRASFVGKWFQRTGDASTVMAILGVRP